MSGARSLRYWTPVLVEFMPVVDLQLEVGRLRLGPDQERVGLQWMRRRWSRRRSSRPRRASTPVRLPSRRATCRRRSACSRCDRRARAAPTRGPPPPRARAPAGGACAPAGGACASEPLRNQHAPPRAAAPASANSRRSDASASSHVKARAYCGGGLNRNASRSASSCWLRSSTRPSGISDTRGGLARRHRRLGERDRPLGRRHLDRERLGVLARDQAENASGDPWSRPRRCGTDPRPPSTARGSPRRRRAS